VVMARQMRPRPMAGFAQREPCAGVPSDYFAQKAAGR
jgi:hypothetical protein